MFNAFRAVGLFTTQYILSRSAKSLLASIPALLAMAGIIYFSYVREIGHTANFIDKYRIAFEASARNKNAEEMWMYARTLVEMQPGDPQSQYLLSLALEECGEVEQSEMILSSLAPENRMGYAPIHSLFADRILQSIDKTITRKDLTRLIHHLRNSHRADTSAIKKQLGLFHLAINETTLAESYFLDADTPESDLELAKLYRDRNNAESYQYFVNRAKNRYENKSKDDPTDINARAGWIKSLILKGDINTVIRLLDETQSNDPNSRSVLAELHVRASQLVRKLRPLDVPRTTYLLERSYQLDSNSSDVLNWAIVLLESGAELSTNITTGLREQLEEEVSNKPGDQSSRFLLARLQTATGTPDLAIKSFMKLAKVNPLQHINLAKLYHRQGNIKASRKHAQLAADFFDEQLKQKSEESLHIHYAESLCYLEKWDQARKHLKELKPQVKISEAISKTWVFQAAGTNAGQWQQRHKYLRAAHDAFPESSLPIKLFARELSHEGARHDSAREHLYQMLAHGAYRDLIHVILGTDSSRLKNWNVGVQHLQQALKIRPQDPMLLNNLAFGLLQLPDKNPLEALELAERANNIVPNHPEILATRGRAYFRLKKYEKCITDLEAAVAKLDSRKDLHAMLAKAYTALNNPAAAKQHQLLAE